MKTANDCDAPMHLAWITDDSGQPRIRWPRIITFVLAVFVSSGVVQSLLTYLLQMPFRFADLLLMSLTMIVSLIIAVEMQRQRVLTGRWRFRLSLGTCLILMMVAAFYFLVLGNDFRANRLGLAANLVMKTKLEELMDGGNAYISTVEGTGVSCDITRVSFSNTELEKLIEISSRRSRNVSQISFLNLEKTSVTDAGVLKLDSCPHLQYLALPSIFLSDETIANIAKCKALAYLSLDEAKLTEKQLAALRISLPKLKLNGKPWKKWGKAAGSDSGFGIGKACFG